MRKLYHHSLSAFCRKVRLVLSEKKLEFHLEHENAWERRAQFLAINPAGEVPVLVEDDGIALSGSLVISEYLNEVATETDLLGAQPIARAEVRRLVDWFDRKFQAEVTSNLVDEKLMKRILGQGQPDSAAIRAGLANLKTHMSYLDYLTDRRTWLAGDRISLADLAAAAHVSCVDYLGDIPWDDHPPAKDWYARMKSRPSLRAILNDRVVGFPPPRHYTNPDF